MPIDLNRQRKTYSYTRVQPRYQEAQVIIDETLDWKNSVRAASTGTHTLTGATPLTVGGVSLVNEDRVLLKNQSSASQNGIYYYVVSGGNYTLERASDVSQETISCGAATYVEEGTNAGKLYILSTPNPITVDSTSLTWTEFSSGGGGGGGGNDYWVSTTDGAIYTTGSVAIRGGLGSVDASTDIGADVFFFVSGSITGSGADDKKSVFGGDVVMSGSLEVSGDQVEITGSLYVSGGVMEVTGTLTVTNGITGSLTRLTDGTAYILAGPNITINTGSNGAVQISGSASGGLSGTGTTNYIPKFASSTSLDDSVLQQGLGRNWISNSAPFITSSAYGMVFEWPQMWTLAPNSTQALNINGKIMFGFGGAPDSVGVGIGTTSTEGKILLAVDSSSTGNDPFANFGFQNLVLWNYNTTNGNSSAIVNYTGEPRGINSYIRFINDDTTNKAGSITFGTSDGAISGLKGERMRIDRLGRVGIGTNDITARGSDVFMFVSGARSDDNTGDKKTVFGGDVRISGSLAVGTGSVFLTSNDIQFGTSTMRIQKNGNDMKFFDINNPGGKTLTELAAASEGLGGSGTTNYVAKFTGTSTLGVSTIFDNGTNVGIGTSSMTKKLVVHGGDALINGLTIGKGNSGNFSNTALGVGALSVSSGDQYNTAVGYFALSDNTSGQGNVAVGNGSLSLNTTSSYNTAIGSSALPQGGGGLSVAIGYHSQFSNTDGYANSSVGYDSLSGITTGAANVALGFGAGSYDMSGRSKTTTGNNNIFIGANASAKNSGDSNSIAIGYFALGLGSNTTVIGNGSTTLTSIPAGNVGIGSTNPDRLLVISGSGASLGIYNSAASAGSMSIDAPVAGGYAQIDVQGSFDLRLNTNSAEAMRINASQNVGIGTNTMTARVNVLGSNGNIGMIVQGGTTAPATNKPIFQVKGYDGGVVLHVSGSSTHGARVGIGTTNPREICRLDVGSKASTATDNYVAVNAATTGECGFSWSDGGTQLWKFQRAASTSNISLVEAGASNIALLCEYSTGNVGINTNNPSEKLHVDTGNIKVDTAGYGVILPSSPSNSGANTLDCYDEKTVGSIRFWTSNAGDLIMETGYDSVSMTRAGRMVTVAGHLKLDTGDKQFSDGRLAIYLGYSGNIPLPAKKTAASVYITGFGLTLTDPVIAYLDTSDAFIYIDRLNAGSAVQDLGDYLETGSEVIFSVTYSV